MRLKDFAAAPDHHFESNRREPMTIKAGNIVSHTGALEWGAGKVLEVTAAMATIQFSDGKNRKIAASHFITLQPAAASSYVPPPEGAPPAKALRSPKGAGKKK
jgi:hypothetical protein